MAQFERPFSVQITASTEAKNKSKSQITQSID